MYSSEWSSSVHIFGRRPVQEGIIGIPKSLAAVFILPHKIFVLLNLQGQNFHKKSRLIDYHKCFTVVDTFIGSFANFALNIVL